MRWPPKLWLVAFAVALPLSAPFAAAPAAAVKQTVCTVTVNSADEKEAFRRYLPAAKYQFVELVERDRPDWLASACRAAIACDVLIISGHYDGSNEFFSDRLETREFLPVDELERVSCSDSCPGLFARLKEVHLFGCNTLNTEAQSSASAEIVRSLVREGHSLKEAERHLRWLNAGHGESSRDRMRQVFKDVPVIYGFSSVAPLGPIAASTLSGYFRTSGASEIGQGRPSGRLLGHFAPYAMTVTQGMTDKDPHAATRRDVCQFADDRLSDAKKLGFVRQLLQRQMAEARMHLDRIQRYAKALDNPARRTPEVAQALADIAGDAALRARFLDFARDADQPAVRARMLKVARDFGWLSAEQRWGELALMLVDLQARSAVGVTEVDLACTLNQEHELDGTFQPSATPGGPADDVPHAAVRACLGSAEGRARTLEGLVSPNEAEVQIARAYLRHRPITDATELRRVAAGIARMRASDAQVRALEALGRHYVSDRDILDLLIRLYSQTSSWTVQAAIAGILIRADARSIASPQLVRTLITDRRPSPAGDNMIDALVRRLRSP
ncbi:hypothetical protein HLB44_08910 [Aquincola sp. S2]|uniref:Uncharacterized protein n=1 Tax=Pseudaquabacterium terrae TaxID=2732868 RepID=A0ABX2EEQ7_9BURK|nr:hypothetical protein [Aquabacterium terrae]NRF67099.1 hypothetical protein [Aquabacterium terrae]